jgi:hypothetical protein
MTCCSVSAGLPGSSEPKPEKLVIRFSTAPRQRTMASKTILGSKNETIQRSIGIIFHYSFVQLPPRTRNNFAIDFNYTIMVISGEEERKERKRKEGKGIFGQ